MALSKTSLLESDVIGRVKAEVLCKVNQQEGRRKVGSSMQSGGTTGAAALQASSPGA